MFPVKSQLICKGATRLVWGTRYLLGTRDGSQAPFANSVTSFLLLMHFLLQPSIICCNRLTVADRSTKKRGLDEIIVILTVTGAFSTSF